MTRSQSVMPFMAYEKKAERLHFLMPIPRGTVLKLRNPSAPKMRKYPAIYVGCGFNFAVGRFGVPIRMHLIESADPRGQRRVIEDRSLWLLYDVSVWARPEVQGMDDAVDHFAEMQTVFSDDVMNPVHKEKHMAVPRFEAEKLIPMHAVLMPRNKPANPFGRKAIYCGAHQLADGTWRYSIKRERPTQEGMPSHYGKERMVAAASLITQYDLRPFGWMPIPERVPAPKPPKPPKPSKIESLQKQLASELSKVKALREGLESFFASKRSE